MPDLYDRNGNYRGTIDQQGSPEGCLIALIFWSLFFIFWFCGEDIIHGLRKYSEPLLSYSGYFYYVVFRPFSILGFLGGVTPYHNINIIIYLVGIGVISAIYISLFRVLLISISRICRITPPMTPRFLCSAGWLGVTLCAPYCLAILYGTIHVVIAAVIGWLFEQ